MSVFDLNEWSKPSKLTRFCLLVCLLFTNANDTKATTKSTSTESITTPSTTTEEPRILKGLNVTLGMAFWDSSLMRYCDTYKPIYDQDEFMDRIVGIVYHYPEDPESEEAVGKGRIFTSGIFISDDHVLTSFNPFRKAVRSLPRAQMYVHYYKAKWVNESNGKHIGYIIDREQFSCARQVIPLKRNEIREQQWHGMNHRHSPVHDLMLIKIANNVEFVEEPYDFHDNVKNIHSKVTGPQRTELAGEHEALPETMKFVSLGMIDYRHIYRHNHLHTVEVKRDEGLIENCDEWFPRSWGYFICIQNAEDYIALHSGAFLFGNEKVFGVGSFALKKGKKSIFVFTDVRRYREMIRLPCDFNTTSFDTMNKPKYVW